VPTDAVLACSIDALQNYQKGMLAVSVELSLKLSHETEVVTQRFTGLDFGIMLTVETGVYSSKVYSRTWVYPEALRKIHTLISWCTNHGTSASRYSPKYSLSPTSQHRGSALGSTEILQTDN
jgi:hypothetical protein